jgi:hypothetical protein
VNGLDGDVPDGGLRPVTHVLVMKAIRKLGASLAPLRPLELDKYFYYE